jgi:hypothetical protein
MKSIDGSWQNNPPELPDMSSQRVPPTVLVVFLDADAPEDTRAGAAASWLDLVERVTRSWPATLRLSVLSLAFAAGTALIAAVVGVTGQLALAAIGLHAGLRRKHPGDTAAHLDEPDA